MIQNAMKYLSPTNSWNANTINVWDTDLSITVPVHIFTINWNSLLMIAGVSWIQLTCPILISQWLEQYYHSDTTTQGLYSLSGKTSYRKISWSLEAARFGFKRFQSPRCLSNFRTIRPLQHPISRLRDFTSFGGKTSYHLVNRGPGR